MIKRILDKFIDFTGKSVPIELESETINVPVYSVVNDLGPGWCSAYARRAAEELFGIKYSFAHAWDRIHKDHVVTTLDSFNSLEDLTKDGAMVQGDLLGVIPPMSPNMRGTDLTGNPKQISHVMLYLGNSPKGEPLFSHRKGFKTHVHPLSYFEPKGYKARFILTPKNSSNLN